MSIDAGTKEEVNRNLTSFMDTFSRRPVCPVLIISYESFRLHADILHKSPVGLLICDEVVSFSNVLEYLISLIIV